MADGVNPAEQKPWRRSSTCHSSAGIHVIDSCLRYTMFLSNKRKLYVYCFYFYSSMPDLIKSYEHKNRVLHTV